MRKNKLLTLLVSIASICALSGCDKNNGQGGKTGTDDKKDTAT